MVLYGETKTAWHHIRVSVPDQKLNSTEDIRMEQDIENNDEESIKLYVIKICTYLCSHNRYHSG